MIESNADTVKPSRANSDTELVRGGERSLGMRCHGAQMCTDTSVSHCLAMV
jgi:hypothetical protein